MPGLRKNAERFGIPALQALLWGVRRCRRVQKDLKALADAVDASDGLLKAVGAGGQIK